MVKLNGAALVDGAAKLAGSGVVLDVAERFRVRKETNLHTGIHLGSRIVHAHALMWMMQVESAVASMDELRNVQR